MAATITLNVILCYASTYATSQEEKENFFDNFQQMLSEIPSGELCIVLGYSNAHVGSRTSDHQWWNVKGPHLVY